MRLSGMVCYTRTAINYGYFIALTLEESFGSTLNPRPRAQLENFLQPLQMLIQPIKTMVDTFNMYLEMYKLKKMHHCLHIVTFAILFY